MHPVRAFARTKHSCAYAQSAHVRCNVGSTLGLLPQLSSSRGARRVSLLRIRRPHINPDGATMTWSVVAAGTSVCARTPTRSSLVSARHGSSNWKRARCRRRRGYTMSTSWPCSASRSCARCHPSMRPPFARCKRRSWIWLQTARMQTATDRRPATMNAHCVSLSLQSLLIVSGSPVHSLSRWRRNWNGRTRRAAAWACRSLPCSERPMTASQAA